MSIASHLHGDVLRYLENVLSRQDNSKTILRCLEDVLCHLGKTHDFKSSTLHYFYSKTNLKFTYWIFVNLMTKKN